MDKKLEFNKALSSLVELASANNNTVTIDEVKGLFDGIITDDSMYEHIFKYLAESKIALTGYMNTNSTPNNSDSDNNSDFDASKLEREFIKMYTDELSNITPLDSSNELILLQQLLEGENTINELTEANLSIVMELVNNYTDKGVTKGDLIQEGNLGLMEAVINYKGEADINTFKAYLKSSVEAALDNAIVSQDTAERIGKHAAERANALDHASTELAKDLEREPTLAELAAYLSLPEDEVEKIVKMSLDALTIEGEE